MSTKQVVSSTVSQNAGFFSAFFNRSKNKVDATQPTTQPGLPSALTQISITSSQHAAIKGEADSPNSPGAPGSKTSSSLSGITITSVSPTVVMSKSGETSPDSTPGSVSSMSRASNSSSRPKTPDDLSTATSVRASDAFMNAVAKKGQSAAQAAKIEEWKVRFGADLVDSLLPQDVQNRPWDPIQTATYENFLVCKMKHPKAAGKLLTPYLTPSGLAHGMENPWERANLYLEVFSLDKLIKHKDDLQARLGAEKYDFLFQFLKNVQSFIGGIQEDSPEALRAFHEITANHNQFVKVADEAFKQLEGSHQDIHRHAELWKRLENGVLNFQDNVGIVRDLQAKLKRAKEFWDQLDTVLKSDYSKKEISSLVEMCFARFSQGHMVAQESDLKQIKTLLERRRIGVDMAEMLTPMLLNHGLIDGANRKLEETDIFLKAMKAQIALDSHLQKLQLLDQFHLQKEKAGIEAQLLHGLRDDDVYQSILEEIARIKRNGSESHKLSAYEIEVAKNLRKKVEKKLEERVPEKAEWDRLGTAVLKKVRNEVIDSMLVDIGRYITAFDGEDGEIDRLTKELESDAVKRKQIVNTVHSNDMLDPRGRGVNILWNAVTVFAMVKGTLGLPAEERRVILDKHLEQLKEKWKRLDQSDAEVAANPDLQLEKRNLHEQIQELSAYIKSPEQTQKPADMLPFFNDYFVAPIGNVLYGKMEGKWVVVDLKGVPQKDREKVLEGLTPKFLEAKTANARPYETLSFDLQLQLLPGKKNGPIKIFVEDPEKVKAVGDLDNGQRSRLIRKKLRTPKQIAGGRDAWSFKELGDHARMIKPEAGWFGSEGWNENRERTAAVDSLELVSKSRLVAAAILKGESGRIDWNTLHQMNAYFESVKKDDLAVLPGSYAGHENFNQALTLYGDMRQNLTNLIIERLPLAGLQLEADKRGSDLKLGAFKIKAFIGFLKGWSSSIGKFVAFVETLPAKRKKDYAFVEQFKQTQQAVDKFVREFPDESLSPDAYIQQTLKGNEKGLGLEARADGLSFAISPLADILESKVFQDKLVPMVEQDRAAYKDPAQHEPFNQFVLSPLFLSNQRLTSMLDELAGIVSDLTPLAQSIRNTRTGIKGKVWKSLRNRTEKSKANLGDKQAFEKFIHGQDAMSMMAAMKPRGVRGVQPYQGSAPLKTGEVQSSSSSSSSVDVDRMTTEELFPNLFPKESEFRLQFAFQSFAHALAQQRVVGEPSDEKSDAPDIAPSAPDKALSGAPSAPDAATLAAAGLDLT